jgi:hypothetical protein
MNNFYFGLMAIMGSVTLCLCLMVLVPQGMWMYLIGTVWGSCLLTWSLTRLKDNSTHNEKSGIKYI